MPPSAGLLGRLLRSYERQDRLDLGVGDRPVGGHRTELPEFLVDAIAYRMGDLAIGVWHRIGPVPSFR
jgi:hypothetical protein